jgi:hypothetical protein
METEGAALASAEAGASAAAVGLFFFTILLFQLSYLNGAK